MIQIKIERIGDNLSSRMKLYTKQINNILPGLGEAVIGKFPSRGWCAEIIGLHPKYKFDRRFLKPNVDYSQANGIGSRGVYLYYNLDENHIYEISEPKSWKRTDRYFAIVKDNKLCRITEDIIKNLLA